MLYIRTSIIGTKDLKSGMLAVCLTVITLFAGAGQLLAAEPWPDGLREAVHSYFQTLQVTEYRTRDSSLEEPLGIQPMTEFDRASHKCHEVPGQVYRIYKVPNYFSEDNGSYMVRSKFQLFYRQAEDIAAIFAQTWGQGSDGAIKVRFKLVDGKWEAVEKREVLE
jgi:hypothetical protein